jgi:hypothetical protein
MKLKGDIDIDFGSRDALLKLIAHTPAAMRKINPIRKHATGVYITDIPYDPINDMAAIDYAEAEDRGYFKLDLLNVYVYSQVKSEQHLISLMQEPNWNLLLDRKFVEKLVHLNNHYQSIKRMPEPINSIPRLAMFLALIRPSKKHLIGESWQEVAKTVWDKEDDGYNFKRSHSCAYSHLVCVHMNLLEEQNVPVST